jgi:RNA polymerase sigma-70 factor, ECF subfamily
VNAGKTKPVCELHVAFQGKKGLCRLANRSNTKKVHECLAAIPGICKMLRAKTCPNVWTFVQPPDTFPLGDSRASVNSTAMCGRTRACALSRSWNSACIRDCEFGALTMGTIAAVIENAQSFAGDVCHEEDREMGSILRRYGPSFQLKAFQYLRNATDAEDAVQDALLSAYKHMNQFKGQAQFSTWLTAIVINSARMQLRRRARQVHVPLDELQKSEEQGTYSIWEQLRSREPSPEEECRGTELRERVAQMLAKLSPCLRIAFQLRIVNGLTVREAAIILGAPEGTVKARVARARKKLRLLLRKTIVGNNRALRASSFWKQQRRGYGANGGIDAAKRSLNL